MKVLTPKEITEQLLNIGINKVNKSTHQTFLLSMLAGAFIGLGAVFYTIVKADATYSFATKQLLGGFVFSVGLILVMVAGAELFTGNSLISIAWASKKVTLKELLANWGTVFIGNMFGAIGLAVIVYISGHLSLNHNAIGETYLKMANAKCLLTYEQAFFRGVLCNFLVCLGVWMAIGGKTVSDKVLAIIFPIALFVAAGFEHSIANLFIIPLGLLIQNFSEINHTTTEALTITNMASNIICVTLGNIVGGGFFVGIVYHTIFLKKSK